MNQGEVIIDAIFAASTPVIIEDPMGATPIHLIASPAHGSLMLCQDDHGDCDVIVMSQKQARELAKALDEWVWNLGP